VKKGETGLKEMLDNGTRQLLMTDAIDKILAQPETSSNLFLRAQLPFVVGN